VIVVIPTNSRPYLLERALQTVDRRADQLRRGDLETVSESGIVRQEAQCGQLCVEEVAGTKKSMALLLLCGANLPHPAHRCAIRCDNAALAT
jgi:hypothetical protein